MSHVLHQVTAPKADTTQTKSRMSRVGKLVLAVLLVAVFEGALRKWGSPTLTVPVVLFRDALALYAIVWIISTGRLSYKSPWVQSLLAWTFLVTGWGLMQLVAEPTSMFIFGIGLRFWLLYLWFGVVVAKAMTETDFRLVCKWIVYLAMGMSCLAVLQFIQPVGAFINRQVDGDEGSVFTVVQGIVRTTGTFSFTTGYTTFLAIVTPLAIALLMPGFNFFQKKWGPFVAIAAVGMGTVVSGSRAAVLLYGLLFVIFILIALSFSRRRQKMAAIAILVVSMLMVFPITLIFSTSVDAILQRFTDAAEAEDIVERMMTMVAGEEGTFSRLTFLGEGLGVGTNFAGEAVSGERAFLLGETETSRIVLEAGWMGLLFWLAKIVLAAYGLWKSLLVVRQASNPLPIMLWLSATIALLTWPLVGQLTVNVLGWLLVSLALASLRFHSSFGIQRREPAWA